MKAERLQRIEELFHAVLECEPDIRRDFLNNLSADDGGLRVEVEALLQADVQAPDLIIASTPVIASGDRAASQAGERINQYRLLREIGRGGMGAVWLAERDDGQFQHRVAIKVIKRGMDTDDVSRRFAQERQILAHLNHPRIARLLDGGETADGRPWFALEYVEGDRLDLYCEKRGLGLVERLELFRQICAAVQYAHQNLVIHRDLKPGNILVAEDGAPKLLDFGIAKLLDPERDTAGGTETGRQVMTLDYASPEQVRGERVTTASDTYSLGVILYELLTGRRPYDLAGEPLHEITRVICEEEPHKPSLADDTANSAASWRRKLMGDLDDIVLKALRKEPDRRYTSAAELAEDIQRHLAGLPVSASRGTFAYRAAKFARRNKVLVTAAVLVAVTLLAGIIATIWQARAAQREAERATQERNKAERISAFLQTTLSYANPNWDSPGYGRGPDVKLADAIRDAEKRIETELKEQPEIRAELHQVIGKAWLYRGEYAAAERSFRNALALHRQLYGEWHSQIARTLGFLASAVAELGQSEESETLNRQAVAMMRDLEPENELLYWQILDLGGRLLINGKREEGEQAVLEALELFRRRFGEQHRGVALANKRLTASYAARGNLDQALAVYRQLIAQSRLMGTHQDTADVWYNQGKTEYYKGDYQAAEQSFNESLKIFQQVQGDDSPLTVRVLYCLAKTHFRQQRYEQAIQEAQRAVEIGRLKRPAGHPQRTTALAVLSHILIGAGQTQRATPILREAASQYLSRPDRSTVEFHDAAGTLGECFTILHRYAEAEPFLLECHASLIATRSEQSPKMVDARRRLVQLYEAWGKPEQAARFR